MSVQPNVGGQVEFVCVFFELVPFGAWFEWNSNGNTTNSLGLPILPQPMGNGICFRRT